MAFWGQTPPIVFCICQDPVDYRVVSFLFVLGTKGRVQPVVMAPKNLTRGFCTMQCKRVKIAFALAIINTATFRNVILQTKITAFPSV